MFFNRFGNDTFPRRVFACVMDAETWNGNYQNRYNFERVVWHDKKYPPTEEEEQLNIFQQARNRWRGEKKLPKGAVSDHLF